MVDICLLVSASCPTCVLRQDTVPTQIANHILTGSGTAFLALGTCVYRVHCNITRARHSGNVFTSGCADRWVRGVARHARNSRPRKLHSDERINAKQIPRGFIFHRFQAVNSQLFGSIDARSFGTLCCGACTLSPWSCEGMRLLRSLRPGLRYSYMIRPRWIVF